jgi:hypothetical protein
MVRTLNYNFCELALGGCGSRAVIKEEGNKRCLSCGHLFEKLPPEEEEVELVSTPESTPASKPGKKSGVASAGIGHTKPNMDTIDNLIAIAVRTSKKSFKKLT